MFSFFTPISFDVGSVFPRIRRNPDAPWIINSPFIELLSETLIVSAARRIRGEFLWGISRCIRRPDSARRDGRRVLYHGRCDILDWRGNDLRMYRWRAYTRSAPRDIDHEPNHDARQHSESRRRQLNQVQNASRDSAKHLWNTGDKSNRRPSPLEHRSPPSLMVTAANTCNCVERPSYFHAQRATLGLMRQHRVPRHQGSRTSLTRTHDACSPLCMDALSVWLDAEAAASRSPPSLSARKAEPIKAGNPGTANSGAPLISLVNTPTFEGLTCDRRKYAPKKPKSRGHPEPSKGIGGSSDEPVGSR